MSDKKPDPVIEAIAAETRAALERRELAAEQAQVYQLAFWPDDERALPGDFIACALFTACKTTSHVTRAELASINGLSVIFTGKRLTQVHADVWMGIMHLARERYSGETVSFRERTLLELIGRHTRQRQRAELKSWVSELQATSVLIQDDAKQKRFGGSLLPWHEEDDGDGHTYFVVDISRELAKILSGNFWRIDWELRKRLQNKPLALWLQTYFARFNKRPVAVRHLHALSGSTAKLKMFRYHLARALDELAAAGGYSAAIDRETDSVRGIERPPRPRRPPPDERQLHLRLVR